MPLSRSLHWGPGHALLSLSSQLGDALLEQSLLGMRDGTSRSVITQSTEKHLPWKVQPPLYQLKTFQTPLAQIPTPLSSLTPNPPPPSSLCP